jgi:hypothetical protein
LKDFLNFQSKFILFLKKF